MVLGTSTRVGVYMRSRKSRVSGSASNVRAGRAADLGAGRPADEADRDRCLAMAAFLSPSGDAANQSLPGDVAHHADERSHGGAMLTDRRGEVKPDCSTREKRRGAPAVTGAP